MVVVPEQLPPTELATIEFFSVSVPRLKTPPPALLAVLFASVPWMICIDPKLLTAPPSTPLLLNRVLLVTVIVPEFAIAPPSMALLLEKVVLARVNV